MRPVSRRTFGAVVGAAAVGTAASGCGLISGGSSGDAGATKSSSADPSARTTLRVWDAQTGSGAAQLVDLNRRFMQTYPNVVIDRVPKAYDAITAHLPAAAGRADGPDVVQVNQGRADMGALVGKRLLAELDGYEKAYQWAKRCPAALRALNSFGPGGTTFGAGSVYGVSQTVELVGIYYNPKVLTRLDVAVPSTWQGWLAAMAVIRKAGTLPQLLGNKDQYPATYLFAMAQDQAIGATAAKDLVFGRKGDFGSPATVGAAELIGKWVAAGFVPSNADSITYRQAIAGFGAGNSAFLVGNSLDQADIATASGGRARFMLPPPATAKGKPVTSGGQGLAWSITARSPHADVAAAYLDYLTSTDAAAVLAKAGAVPIAVPDVQPAAGTLAGDIAAGWAQLARADSLVPYLDFATPTFYPTASTALGHLLDGTASPAQAVQAMQADYDGFVKPG